jgi:hypothetical protein
MTSAELIAFIKKHPISVGCGALAVALGAGIYFRGGEIPSAENDLQQKTADVERHGANIRNADDLKVQVDTLVAANKEIDSRLIRASQFGPNQLFFYRLQSETGVKLIDFKQGGLTAPKGGKTAFTPIAFTVSATGTMAQVMDFLFRLESGGHYCRVNTAMLSTTPQNRNNMTLTVNLELLGLP